MSRPDARLLYTALKKDRNNKSRRILNDIMYYLRKLIKLARTAQSLSVLEGKEAEFVESELASIKEEIDRIEEQLS